MTYEELEALGIYIEASNDAVIFKTEILNNELVFTVRREAIRAFMTFLLNDANCDFKMLVDICGVDYPERDERFDVVYNLLSLKHNQRVRVKIRADEIEHVDSVSSIFSAAGWFEREIWDMYGIFFEGHADLRRILTDYGFEGHPLRKDFPMTGYVEVRYDEDQKRVVYEPVKLTQAYRNFDFTSPWEAMTEMQKAGAEKAAKPTIIAGEEEAA